MLLELERCNDNAPITHNASLVIGLDSRNLNVFTVCTDTVSN